MKSESVDRAFVSVLPVIIVLIAGVQLLPAELAVALVKENGPVEMLSALGYIVCACRLFLAAARGRIGDGFSAGLLVLLLGLRELDFHTMFTTMGVFKTRYYISPEVPAGEKLIVSMILMCILAVAVRFLKRNFKHFWSALRARQLSAISVGMAVVFALLSKTLDSASGPIEPLIASFHSEPKTFLRITEEISELAIPLYLLLAVFIYINKARRV